jgi:hypothetical protein
VSASTVVTVFCQMQIRVDATVVLWVKRVTSANVQFAHLASLSNPTTPSASRVILASTAPMGWSANIVLVQAYIPR